jgi:catechol 2,3-dioxygenase-like lactoylglutathione lyase family enzyme
VRGYDEAKAWYCNLLGFNLIEDTLLADGKRWVLLAPKQEPNGAWTYSLDYQAPRTTGSRRFSVIAHPQSVSTFLEDSVRS